MGLFYYYDREKMTRTLTGGTDMNFKNFVTKVLPIVASIFVMAAALAYIIIKLMGDRAYREKWKDYNDCGLA